MRTIDVRHETLMDMAKNRTLPTQKECCCCGRNIALCLPNNDGHDIFAATEDIYRVVVGTHPDFSARGFEEVYYFCLDCFPEMITRLKQIIPQLSQKPIDSWAPVFEKGYFTTIISFKKNEKGNLFIRYQSGLHEIKKIIEVLEVFASKNKKRRIT